MDITKFGQAKTGGDSALSLGICDPCGKIAACEDSLQIGNAINVSSFVYQDSMGVNHTIAIAPTATGAENVRAAIARELAAFEDSVFVQYDAGTPNFTIRHIGQGKIISVGAVTAVTRKCNLATRCDNKIAIADSIQNVTRNGTIENLAAPLVYGTATAAQVKTELESILTSEIITVTDDATNGQWVINIHASANNKYKINGIALTVCNCRNVFVP